MPYGPKSAKSTVESMLTYQILYKPQVGQLQTKYMNYIVGGGGGGSGFGAGGNFGATCTSNTVAAAGGNGGAGSPFGGKAGTTGSPGVGGGICRTCCNDVATLMQTCQCHTRVVYLKS